MIINIYISHRSYKQNSFAESYTLTLDAVVVFRERGIFMYGNGFGVVVLVEANYSKRQASACLENLGEHTV